MKGMINFTSQVFPQQILYCSDRDKRKSKDSWKSVYSIIDELLSVAMIVILCYNPSGQGLRSQQCLIHGTKASAESETRKVPKQSW